MSNEDKDNNKKGPGIDQKTLERLAEILGVGLFRINLATGAIGMNSNIAKFTGYGLEDLPNTDQTRDSLIIDEDRDFVNDSLRSILNGQNDSYHIEYRMRRRDSSIASFEEAAFISEYSEDNKPLYMSAMALDLSRLKWAEEKSRSLEMEVRNLSAASGKDSLPEENRLLRAGIAAAAMVIGAFHQDYDTVLIQALQMIGESVGANYVGFWRNTEREDSTFCGLKYHWTTRAHTVGAENNNLLFNYENLIPDWKERLAEQHYIICKGNEVSRDFLDAFDMKNAEHILLAPYYLHGGFWGMIGITRNEDIPFTACEAEALMTSTTIIAFSISRNETFGKITLDRKKAMQNTLAKGEFLSRMSHEMRTPLNAIIGMTDIALKEKDINKVMEYLKKVEVSSHLMLTIINDVLDMSKIEAGKLEIVKEPFDFMVMLRNAENIVKVKMDEKKQRFTVKCDQSISNLVISDEHRLLQVIVNLLNNAMKFTPENGEISLTATIKQIGDNRVKLRVEVKDSGIGVTLEQQKKLFIAFEQADGSITRKYGGTGLGLAICKKILNALGGDIWVISKINQGACFFFEIEADLGISLEESSLRTLAQLGANTNEALRDWKRHTILLADDVEINREIIEITLCETGVTIISARNGVEAVEKFSSNPGGFSLILMDVQMPVMDGLNATRQIRSMDAPNAIKVPIIAMTANAFKEDIDLCLEAGMNEHVAKPISMDSFFEVLDKYL